MELGFCGQVGLEGEQEVVVAHCGDSTQEVEVLGIIIVVGSPRGCSFRKIQLNPLGLRSPRPNKKQGVNRATPISKQTA